MEGFVFCSQCGKQVAVGKKFCTECGSPIPVNSVPVAETPIENKVDEDATISFNPAQVQQETSVVLEKPAAEPVAEAVIKAVAPVVEPAAPVVEAVAPVVEPAAPVVEAVAPVVEPSAPAVEPVAPVVEPSAPAVEPVAPAVDSIAPVAVEPVAPVAPAMAAAPAPVAPEAPKPATEGMTAAQQYEAAMGQKVTAVAPAAEAAKKNKKADKYADIPAAYKPVNMWGYYGLSILLNLPIIGFICTFIFAFAPKNRNIKNYARSYFCAWIVGAIITILMIVLILFAGGAILSVLGGLLGDEAAVDGAGEVLETIQGMFGI